MHYTIEALINGRPVADWYAAATEHWREVLSHVDPTDANAIAEAASAQQGWFEQNCGGRWIGQEIMVVVGIGQYYTTASGFDEGDNLAKARAMYDGLLRSPCSGEIHGYAQDMAANYPELTEQGT